MSKPFFATGAAIAYTVFLIEGAIAVPLPSFPSGSTSQSDTNTPLCYVQFQGSSAIDVSNVCGQKPGETPAKKAPAVAVSNSTVPPVFDPKVVNASTTGQCNFVDGNGNPCPQAQTQ
jgi:hypothetical protein